MEGSVSELLKAEKEVNDKVQKALKEK